MSKGEIAAAVGVLPSTLSEWQRAPHFLAAVEAESQRRHDAATREAQTIMRENLAEITRVVVQKALAGSAWAVEIVLRATGVLVPEREEVTQVTQIAFVAPEISDAVLRRQKEIEGLLDNLALVEMPDSLAQGDV